MSTTTLQIVFEGPDVRTGTINAVLFAESLVGYSEVFTRANTIINGDESDASVRIQSDLRRGSFIATLELVQNVRDNAEYLITAHQFFNAGALASVLGFAPAELAKEFVKDIAKETVVSLFKWLRGKKPDEVRNVNDDSVEVRSNHESRVVNVNVFNLYGDSAIRTGLDKLTCPLRRGEIDRIKVKQNDQEQAILEKSEAEYFEAEPFKLETSREQMRGERDAVLVVSKLSFKEGVNWTFFERGATVVAKIEDQEFWKQVHRHSLTFGEGDLLKVRLKWQISRKQKQLKQKNIVVKVLEKLERPKQIHLDGLTDEQPFVHRPSRKIRTDMEE